MRNMARKTKHQIKLEENINFLKFELRSLLETIQKDLEDGKIISAHEIVKQLQKDYWVVFPFHYGSEMDAKGYSDLKVLIGES
jgi:uncharacterized membrane-anchored protein YhcB (DUF1043 family)